MSVIYLQSDNTLLLENLRKDSDQSYLNSATVTLTILNPDGTALSGVSWPVTMAYISSSNGSYSYTLPYTVPLTKNVKYKAVVVSDAGLGYRHRWEYGLVAQIDRA